MNRKRKKRKGENNKLRKRTRENKLRKKGIRGGKSICERGGRRGKEVRSQI
jgi:hypothetical protein